MAYMICFKHGNSKVIQIHQSNLRQNLNLLPPHSQIFNEVFKPELTIWLWSGICLF